MLAIVSYVPQRLYEWLPISYVIGNEGLVNMDLEQKWKAIRNAQKLSIYGGITMFFGCLIALECENLVLGTKLLGATFIFGAFWLLSVILAVDLKRRTKGGL